MHLKTLPIRFPDGGTFLYKLLPAQNITKKKKKKKIFENSICSVIVERYNFERFFTCTIYFTFITSKMKFLFCFN